jgi:hypothetical protein
VEKAELPLEMKKAGLPLEMKKAVDSEMESLQFVFSEKKLLFAVP